jgi:hypothetical protein
VDASKSLTAGALVFCFFVNPTVGAFTWVHYKKTIVKKEVEKHIIAGINKDDLVLLIFSKEETQTLLRWEHSKEFEYNHQMYDVVETLTFGNTICYWCWWDQEETKLNRRLRELAAQACGEAPKIGEKNEPSILSLKTLYCAVYYGWKISTPELFYKQFCSFFDLYSSIFIQPPTPPPRLV